MGANAMTTQTELKNILHRSFALKTKYFLLGGTLVLLSACGDVNISPKGEDPFSLKTQSHVCTEDPKEIGQYSKILFVVDKSGSNGQTDPDRTNGRRATAIRDFLNKNRTNEYIYWGFIEFHNDRAQSYIPEQGGPNKIFTNDPSLMDQALDQFSSQGDNGATPYRAALQLTTSAIREDLKEDTGANYNIIFISDGEPTDYNNDAQLYSEVEALVNLSTGNIHLSTVYYGPKNNSASSRMARMAEIGFGKFQDTNVDPHIDIDNLLSGGTSNEPYLIKSFMVYNLSAANCDDGSVGADSDADGLCDKDELKYNQIYTQNEEQAARMEGKLFDPQNRNSFHPYYKDSVYLKHIVYGESIKKNCADNKDEDMDLLNTCEEKFIYNKNPQGPTNQWTEEMVGRGKEGNPKYFDSDGDGILDGLEFLFFKNKSVSLNYQSLYERTNGYQHEYLIQNRLNPINPNSEKPYGINFQRVQPNSRGQNCYSYQQDELPLYNTKAVSMSQVSGNLDLTHADNENVILIYYVQVPEYAPNSKGILRYSYQKMTKGLNHPKDLNMNTDKFEIWTRPGRGPQ